ncbi:hypothetical protein ACJ41O_010259 [Fusarium nematophilum]
MESDTLKYDAIPPGRFFRLLRIHPGSPGDPLVCDLFTSGLDDAPPYTALSYVWGDPTMNVDLACSGNDCKIARSLSDGLSRVRRTDEAQVAWADAICINQKDNVEKGHQVDLMGAIYDKARDVLVWLGPDDTGSAVEAFRCLRTINDKIFKRENIEYFTLADEEAPFRPVGVKPDGAASGIGGRSVLGRVLGENGKDCVRMLYELPWFSRVWVLQEVGLATAATAFWGDSSIDFSEIAAFICNVYFIEDLKHYLGREISDILSGAPLYALWNVWSTYEKKDSWMVRNPTLRGFAEQIAEQADLDFILVLEASRYFNATNKLDHVYAFLGHPRARMPGSDKTFIQADYSLSLEEQHRLLAAGLSHESLNFLVQAQQTEESLSPGFGHPTWVPRWNEKTPTHADAMWEAWDASLRKSQSEPFRAKVDGEKLFISGILLDTVDQFTRRIEASDFGEDKDGGGQLVELCWDLAKQKPHPYGRDKAVEAFASTLICYYKIRGNQLKDGRESVVEQFAGFCMISNPRFYRDNMMSKHGLWTMNTMINIGHLFGPVFKVHATNRRFFVTKDKGFWGLGPAAMQAGDVCGVLFGVDVPFMLRPVSEGEYKVVGQCYMYGFMDGGAVEAWRSGQKGYEKEDIVLV